MKTQLSADDLMRLDAARGLDLNSERAHQNTRGQTPSVEEYNKAVKKEIIIGRPIVPVGTYNQFGKNELEK